MPTCPICKIAYLGGEGHRCAPKSQSVVAALAGAVMGGVLGFFAVLIPVGVLTESAQSGLLAIFAGVPLGAVIGAIVGARAGRS